MVLVLNLMKLTANHLKMYF